MIATLSPIRVIDSGLNVYPEFAAGPFFYRSGDALAVEEIERLNGVTPTTLANFLEKESPDGNFARV